MGLACPVCATPQADAEHLANHLAFTAMLGDADHEAWLDDHTPGWGEDGPAELAARLTDVEGVEYPQMFEDTTDGDGGPEEVGRDHHRSHDHDHGRGHADRQPGVDGRVAAGDGPGSLTDERAAIYERARELTERMRSAGDDTPEDGDESA
ncbi:hypothetical protein BRD17_04490 [Halobacteriales archaeon SW_7_68_16]|nr:MAG: hypothetical protein BRD17_04490 [Halobacteriales archaeon SW_7_68_16]